MTVTVDRIGNAGTATAQQEADGKSVHVRASRELGETLEVRLTDRGGYFEATLVDRAAEIHPRRPGIAPDTSDVGADPLDRSRNRSHSFRVGSSLTGSTADPPIRRRTARRKT